MTKGPPGPGGEQRDGVAPPGPGSSTATHSAGVVPTAPPPASDATLPSAAAVRDDSGATAFSAADDQTTTTSSVAPEVGGGERDRPRLAPLTSRNDRIAALLAQSRMEKARRAQPQGESGPAPLSGPVPLEAAATTTGAVAPGDRGAAGAPEPIAPQTIDDDAATERNLADPDEAAGMASFGEPISLDEADPRPGAVNSAGRGRRRAWWGVAVGVLLVFAVVLSVSRHHRTTTRGEEAVPHAGPPPTSPQPPQPPTPIAAPGPATGEPKSPPAREAAEPEPKPASEQEPNAPPDRNAPVPGSAPAKRPRQPGRPPPAVAKSPARTSSPAHKRGKTRATGRSPNHDPDDTLPLVQ